MATPQSRVPSTDETNLFSKYVFPLLTRKVTEKPAEDTDDSSVYDRDDVRRARRNCGGVSCMALNAQERNFDGADLGTGLGWSEQINSRLNEVRSGGVAQTVPVVRTGNTAANVMPMKSARLG